MAQKKPHFVTICEDSVNIHIFSLNLENNFASWKVLCENINTCIKLFSNEYIWHKDELKFHVSHCDINTENIPIYLRSTTCFGDNIEDEWFIVYLVMEISKNFNDVIIQMSDNDGEFLLIEAAPYLPTWVKPDYTENRVFVYNQHIHLIPPHLATCDTKLKLTEALSYIVNYPQETKVSTDIENAILSRVAHFPQRIYDNFHYTVVNLPLTIATLIIMKPSYISAIVEAYCNHDILDTKFHQDINEDMIKVRVKFTKCLYAMLMHCRLKQNIIKCNTTSNEKSNVLGIKLTRGFQSLMKSSKEDVFSNREFQRYLNNLKETGYFRNKLEYSKEYNELLEKAKQHFLEFECPQTTLLSKQIEEIMHSDEYRKLNYKLKHDKSQDNLIDDSDDWLNIDSEQLNNFLHTRYTENINIKKNDLISPQVITTKLQDFLNKASDFEGVDTRDSTEEINKEKIEFDSNEFINYLDKIMSSYSSDNFEEALNKSDIDEDSDDTNDELEEELSQKLKLFQSNKQSKQTIALNLKQSLKEEGITGPSSNLLNTIGIDKTYIMDSDK
ncbi:hypothetical protein ACJJTC_014876 [Scirpophaga incertulas]